MNRLVDISDLRCFENSDRIADLNNLFRRFPTVMPHQVSSVTGCALDDSMVFLVVLYDKALVEMLLLVYHRNHPSYVISTRDVLDGFPTMPFYCDICGEDIDSPSEFVYDFAFRQKEPLQFMVNQS